MLITSNAVYVGVTSARQSRRGFLLGLTTSIIYSGIVCPFETLAKRFHLDRHRETEKRPFSQSSPGFGNSGTRGLDRPGKLPQHPVRAPWNQPSAAEEAMEAVLLEQPLFSKSRSG